MFIAAKFKKNLKGLEIQSSYNSATEISNFMSDIYNVVVYLIISFITYKTGMKISLLCC